jgi:hypothetical protein
LIQVTPLEQTFSVSLVSDQVMMMRDAIWTAVAQSPKGIQPPPIFGGGMRHIRIDKHHNFFEKVGELIGYTSR